LVVYINAGFIYMLHRNVNMRRTRDVFSREKNRNVFNPTTSQNRRARKMRYN